MRPGPGLGLLIGGVMVMGIGGGVIAVVVGIGIVGAG